MAEVSAHAPERRFFPTINNQIGSDNVGADIPIDFYFFRILFGQFFFIFDSFLTSSAIFIGTVWWDFKFRIFLPILVFIRIFVRRFWHVLRFL